MIPFNNPFLTGKEAHYMYQAVYTGKLSGNGVFTKKCQEFFETRYGFKKCLMTTSCTDALEMAQAIIKLISNDTLRITIAENGRKSIQQFKWDNSFIEFKELLHSVY